MRKIVFFIGCICVFIFSYAQPGCPNITVTASSSTVGCSNSCSNLSATVFPIGQTTTYSVSSIPFAPPYPITGSGIGVSVNTDDVWSPVVNLPFPFCFFGSTYNQCIIGSNGVISFNTTSSGGYCPWSFSASCPSPALITNAIFGVYHDIDPSVCGAVSYTLIGTAPCRMLVVNFNNVCHYSCNNLKSSFQMVLYETTNVIEVYVQNKPTCTSWNGGNALIGIQNAAGTVGYTPPGRNTGPWSASNEAWRFTPTGPPIYGNIQWYDASGMFATGNTVTVCPTSTTTYTAVTTYTRCDGLNITVSSPITISVPNPVITASNSGPVCAGSSLSLSASSTTTAISYAWYGPNGFTSNQQNTSITNAGVNASGTYTVVVTSPTGTCGAITTVSVINPGTITIFPASTICQGNNFTLTSSNNSTLTTNYSWSGPNGFASNQQNPVLTNVLPNQSGVYSVTTTVVSGTLQCSASASSSLTIIPIYTPNVTPNQTVCVGDNAIISATATSASSYSWAGPNNFTSNTQSNSFTNAQSNQSGTYTVTAIFTSGNTSCYTYTTTDLAVLPKINFTLAPVPLICPGDPIIINGPTGASSYTWTNPYGQVVSNQPTLNIPNANSGLSGAYTVSVQPNGGCISSNSVNVTVLTPISFSITPNDLTLCKGDSATVFALCTGGSGIYTYQWWPYTGLYFPAGFANIVKPSQTTYYTIIANDAACPQQTITANFWVNVLPIPVPNFQYNKISGCKPLCVHISANAQPPSINTIWDFGYNLYANGDSLNYCFDKPGAYPVKVFLIDSNGCKNTVQAPFSINVYPRPEPAIYFSPSAPTLLHNEVEFSASFNNGPITYWHWDFGDIMTNTDTANTQNSIYTYTYVSNYPVMLIATNIYGCTDTVFRLISVTEEFTMYIPDAFTPNGDGLNDVFNVKGAGFVEDGFEMRIYDRWGELIFKTNNVYEGWDGKVKGVNAKNDVYVYKIRCFTTVQNIKKEFVGHVTLYR